MLGMLLQAATLEKLGLEDMTQKSTAIVRGRVTGSYAAAQGPLIYTHYRIRVSERWKGPASASLDVVVPGGVADGLRQSFSGAPKLAAGHDYVLFLWTGPSGLTHIIGLSQGLFEVNSQSNGDLVVSRPASAEMMLDSGGRSVRDEAMTFRLLDLHRRVSSVAGEGVPK